MTMELNDYLETLIDKVNQANIEYWIAYVQEATSNPNSFSDKAEKIIVKREKLARYSAYLDALEELTDYELPSDVISFDEGKRIALKNLGIKYFRG